MSLGHMFPWLGRRVFAHKHAAIDSKRRALLSRIARQQAKLDEGDFMEIGVYLGGSALFLAEALQRSGSNRHLHLLDTWEGIVRLGAEDAGAPIGPHYFSDTSPEAVSRVLRKYGLAQHCVLHKGWLRETLPSIPGPFSLVHLDCDLYDSTKEALNLLLPRISPHGVIVVDDYGTDLERRFPGVYKAVQECLERPDGGAWKVEILGGHWDESALISRR